jgi:hypothetical protein
MIENENRDFSVPTSSHSNESLTKSICRNESSSMVSPNTSGAYRSTTSTIKVTTSVPVSISTSRIPSSSTARNKKEERWLSILEDLKCYKEKHGNCLVPRGFVENPQLGSWVAEQRKQFKLLKDGKPSSITAERILMLDNLSFAWNAQEAAWTKHVTNLKRFIDENRHCNVPLNCSKYPKLGLWVKEQRRHYTLMTQGKPSHMNQARVDELTKLGFRWDTHEATFLTRLRELEQYKQRYGTCLVPTTHPKLGPWCHHQRRQYRRWKEGRDCHITQERIDLLTKMGFVWNPRDSKNETSTTVSLSGASSVSSVSDSEQEDHDDFDLPPRKRQKTA